MQHTSRGYICRGHFCRASCGIVAATLSLWVGGFGAMGVGMATAREGAPVHSQKQAVTDDSEAIFTFPQNFEPPGDGRPEDTRGSGSRTGACSAAALGSEAVMADPDRQETSEGITEGRIRAIAPPDNFGLTLQSHPRVFINFDGDVADTAVMRVQDEAGEYDERVTLPVNPERRIQGFALPDELPPLAVGKNYKWTILVACDGRVNPYHPIFSGWVQRVAADGAAVAVSQQSIEAQVEWYASEGYWYDTVAVLDDARQVTPTDSTVSLLWAQLLEFVDGN